MKERQLTIVAAMTGFIVAVSLSVMPLRFNWSPSIPRGVYLKEQGPIGRGTVVEVCVGRFWEIAKERSYLPGGDCPGGQAPVAKVVAGLPGDVVQVTADWVKVGEDTLRRSERLMADSEGRQLPWVGEGALVLGEDDLWLAGTEVGAIDSRLYGPVALSQARCCLRPLWIQGRLEVIR